MANIGNENIIKDFKNALNVDIDKKVFNSLDMDEKLKIVSLKRKIRVVSTYSEDDYELMNAYIDKVDNLESNDDDEESEDDDIKKRKAKGISKKRKATKVKKSKKQRKIKKKSKTFRRFA